ncbi:MAG: translation elongation factor [Thermoprotei archaeon]
MLTGSVQAVLSRDQKKGETISDKLGKRHESDWVPIYYQKSGEGLRSVLLPRSDKILEEGQAVSLADVVYVAAGGELNWEDGEKALLAEASGAQGELIAEGGASRYFSELSIADRTVQAVVPLTGKGVERGFVFLDRIFPVKGVGTVALGFSMTEVAVHDKLVALPQEKEVEVKSIQVLDEDQEKAGLGVRVGLALRNVSADELQGVYALAKDPSTFSLAIPIEVHKFKWVASLPERVHAISGGVRVTASLGSELKVDGPFPKSGRAILIDVNAKPKTPRVLGYVDLKGRTIPWTLVEDGFTSRITPGFWLPAPPFGPWAVAW